MKNFVVITESVKGRDGGLAAYQNYLKMKDHPNHKAATSEIVHLLGANAFQNIVMDTFKYEAEEGERRFEKGIRGRYKLDSFAQSFVLSIPKINEMNEHIRPTNEQWRVIMEDVVKAVYRSIKKADANRKLKETAYDEDGEPYIKETPLPPRYNHIGINDFAKNIFANVHVQHDGNDHLNIVMGKLIGGEIIKEITQKRVLDTMKRQFTLSLAQQCGLTIENYNPVNTKKAAKRRKVAAEHTIFNREYKKQMVEEFGKELIKPFQNYVNNIEKDKFEKAGQWLDTFEEQRADMFEKNVSEFGFEGAFQMDQKLVEAISSSTFNAEIKQAPVPAEKPRKVKRDKNGTIIGFIED